MIDRFDNDHAGGSRIAQRVVVLKCDAKVVGENIQSMAGKLRPGASSHTNAVEPTRVDAGALMEEASGRQRTAIKRGMRDRDAITEMADEGGVKLSELGFAAHVVTIDAVDSHVERVKLIARINQGFVFERDATIGETDDPNLADTAGARAGSLDVDGDEIWRARVQVQLHRLRRMAFPPYQSIDPTNRVFLYLQASFALPQRAVKFGRDRNRRAALASVYIQSNPLHFGG